MSATKRIVINTVASYSRTLLGMALGFFSGRWLLQILQPVDYGLMGVVGATISFVTFLNGVMGGVVSRYLAFSIGQGKPEETTRWFNVALSAHCVSATILFALGWFFGGWVICTYLNIPPDRLDTALLVFHLSLVSAFCGMLYAPFYGMFLAKQRIYEQSIWNIAHNCIIFAFIYGMLSYTGDDAWRFYCQGAVSLGVVVSVSQMIRAMMIFPECRIRFMYWWDWSCLRKIIPFAVWNMFGAIGLLLRGQGSAILLNKYFSPTLPANAHVNASYSVGTNISNYAQTLSSSMFLAFYPEVVATEGRGQRTMVLRQSLGASKFGTLLVLLFVIPLFCELDFFLVQWLVTPPALAAPFCLWILVMLILDQITNGHMIAISALGDMRRLQLTLGTLFLLTLPIAWLLLECGGAPTSIGWAFVLTMGLASLARVVVGKQLINLSPWQWLREVCIPLLVTTCICGGTGWVIRMCMGEASWLRFVVVESGVFLSWCACGWYIVLDNDERRYCIEQIRKRLARRRHGSGNGSDAGC